MFLLESSRRPVHGCQMQSMLSLESWLCWGVQAKGMMECCRSTLQQVPWTDGRWAATACLRRASPPASSERRWTTIWVAAERQPSLPGTAPTQQHSCVELREGSLSSSHQLAGQQVSVHCAMQVEGGRPRLPGGCERQRQSRCQAGIRVYCAGREASHAVCHGLQALSVHASQRRHTSACSIPCGCRSKRSGCSGPPRTRPCALRTLAHRASARYFLKLILHKNFLPLCWLARS